MEAFVNHQSAGKVPEPLHRMEIQHSCAIYTLRVNTGSINGPPASPSRSTRSTGFEIGG